MEIGFKQRREDLSVDSVNRVSPPIFHEIISPELPQEYGAFDNIFRFVVQNDPKSIQALYFWILEDSKWKRPDFFKSWRIIRNEFKEKIDEDQKLRNLARILDQALCEYITENHSPTVNLQLVLDDYLRFKDADKIISEIRNGKYRLE